MWQSPGMELSIAAGETTPSLLEETIGANFERTVAAYAEREALVEVQSGQTVDLCRARP